MLMDTFYANDVVQYDPITMKRMRCDFNEFMLDVHHRIHAYKKEHPQADPIPPVAAALSQEARLLCFDEMQIPDIADAMIIKRINVIVYKRTAPTT
jgi:protein AFG1